MSMFKYIDINCTFSINFMLKLMKIYDNLIIRIIQFEFAIVILIKLINTFIFFKFMIPFM